MLQEHVDGESSLFYFCYNTDWFKRWEKKNTKNVFYETDQTHHIYVESEGTVSP